MVKDNGEREGYNEVAVAPRKPDVIQAPGDEERNIPGAEHELPPELVLKPPFQRPRVGALRNIVATFAVGLTILGLVWFFDRPGGFGISESINLTASSSGPAPRVGKEAPDFRVQGLDGEYFRLSDFRGQPVWINFWATWCPPCRAETPDIQAVYEEREADGLVIIALSIGEDASTVRGYVERTGTTFTMGLDRDTAIAAQYRIVGIPTHYFVDADGILREWRIGSMSLKTMNKMVDEIMSTDLEGSDP